MVFKGTNSLFLMAFVLSAVVQFNDPDPLLWIVVYLSAVVMCALEFSPYRQRWLPWLMFVCCTAGCVGLVFGLVGSVTIGEVFESLSMQTQAVEEAREAGGLLLVALWSLILGVRQAYQPSRF
jgi:hypothetical protein